MKTHMYRITSAGVAVLGLALVPLYAQTATAGADAGTLNEAAAAKAHEKRPPYSPYADRKFPVRPFFGDTHLHTGFSMDAGAFGCRRAPRDALRFARGEQVMA